jgi:hypothetical protein
MLLHARGKSGGGRIDERGEERGERREERGERPFFSL